MRATSLAAVALFGVLATGAFGDDRPASPRGRGSLPAMWAKLGLSDEQKQQIYAAQSEFRAKIDGLQQQVRQLQKQERVAMERILTDAQRARLRELVSEKGPASIPPSEGGKPSGKP